MTSWVRSSDLPHSLCTCPPAPARLCQQAGYRPCVGLPKARAACMRTTLTQCSKAAQPFSCPAATRPRWAACQLGARGYPARVLSAESRVAALRRVSGQPRPARPAQRHPGARGLPGASEWRRAGHPAAGCRAGAPTRPAGCPESPSAARHAALACGKTAIPQYSPRRVQARRPRCPTRLRQAPSPVPACYRTSQIHWDALRARTGAARAGARAPDAPHPAASPGARPRPRPTPRRARAYTPMIWLAAWRVSSQDAKRRARAAAAAAAAPGTAAPGFGRRNTSSVSST